MTGRLALALATLAGLVTATSAAGSAVPSLAYVANQGSGTVSVIDTATDAVVRTIPAQGSLGKKIQAVVTDLAGEKLFVVDAASNALLVVEAHSGKLLRAIAVGHGPEGASLSPSGKQIAVCVEDDNEVVFVNPATEAISARIAIQGKNPEHCVFSDDERWLLTSNENSDDVDIVDVQAGRSVALVHTSGGPRGIAWVPNRHTAYVAQERGGGVDLIDAEKHAVISSTHTGLRPADVIISNDGKSAFVSNGGDAAITRIDVRSGALAGSVTVGKRPWNMALSPGGGKLYVANGRSNSVSVIDTRDLHLLKTIAVGELPWGVYVPHAHWGMK